MPRHVSQPRSEYFGPGAFVTLVVAWVIAAAGLGMPLLVRLREVLAVARRARREPADAILVVGRALERDHATPIYRARLAHAAELFHAGLAPRVMVAGGLTGNATRSEAAVGCEHLLALGVPAASILLEDRSTHTLENLANVRQTARSLGWHRLLAVSDPLHLARVLAVGRGLGLDLAFSPAAAPYPRGWRYWLLALSEAHLLHWYRSGVAYSRLVGAQRYLDRVT
jgi:uncharacterized SAM-binding protein YcdF (DUF218 family)